MSIWKKAIPTGTLAKMSAAMNKGNMVGHIGIEFTNIGDNYLEATMPVDERTRQPFGLLHGGASVSLAESLGSYASYLVAGDDKQCVGVDINATHLRSMKSGSVTARATPVKLGKTLHVWDIKIHETGNESAGLVCLSKLSVMVVEKRPTKTADK